MPRIHKKLHPIPTLNPTFIPNFFITTNSKISSIKPYFKQLNHTTIAIKPTSKLLRLPNSSRNHTAHTKNNHIKIRPEFKIPVLNHTSPPLKITTIKGYF